MQTAKQALKKIAKPLYFQHVENDKLLFFKPGSAKLKLFKKSNVERFYMKRHIKKCQSH